MSKHIGFAVAALLVAGCGPPATQATAKHIDAAAAPTPAAPPAPSNDVELLDPGRAPRAPLRYRFEAGTHEPYVTISDDDVGTDGPIRTYHAAEVQVEEVLPDGSARLEVALRRDTSGDEPDRRKLHIDARGQLVEDGSADNSIAADTLLAALPVEPVGVGARWRTRRPHTADSTIIYELIALEPGGAHLRETATIFEQGVGIGNETTWDSETTTEQTGDLHIAWGRVVARADWQARQSGRTVSHDLLSGTGDPDRADIGTMTFRTSIVPAGAFSPPAFFPGDLGPVLMGMMPLWLPIGSPLCVAPQGPLSGPFATQYPGGTPAVAGTCNNGQPDGDWRWWDERGDLISEGHFHAGKPDGTWTQRSHGRALGSFTLHDGTGEVIAWWQGGGKRLEVGFVDGVPHGAITAWRADGTRELEGHFETPRGQGTWTAFDANGNVTRTWTLNEAGRPVQ